MFFYGKMSDREDIDVEALKRQLYERRDKLERLISAHHVDTKPVLLDQTTVGRLSRMDELQTQAMSIETERRRKEEIARIEASLSRVEEGEYGYCITCGEEIENKRIELDPATPTCVGCAK